MWSLGLSQSPDRSLLSLALLPSLSAVVPKSGAKLNPKAIQSALGPKLSKFKVPVRIFVVDSIPKTATGKIQRRHVSTAFVEKAKKEDGGKRESKL